MLELDEIDMLFDVDEIDGSSFKIDEDDRITSTNTVFEKQIQSNCKYRIVDDEFGGDTMCDHVDNKSKCQYDRCPIFKLYPKVTVKGKDKFTISFLGRDYNYHCSYQSLVDTIRKRRTAIDMIPYGAKIIPEHTIHMFNGTLVCGILADSLYKVAGVCENGIRGYSCSVFYAPTEEELKQFIIKPYMLNSEFKVK